MVRNAVKKDCETEKNNTTLMLRADIPFWTILISCKHHDIQQWRMLFLITVYLSVDR